MPQSPPSYERTGGESVGLPIDASSTAKKEAARAETRAASNRVIEVL